MNPEEASEDNEPEISKSQRKREADAIRDFAAKLIKAPPHQLKNLPLSDKIKQAITDCPPPSTRGAHKRHIQYIGKLIRKTVDLHKLEQLLDTPPSKTNPHREFCDLLITSFTAHADTLRARYPAVSLQQARQLARTAANVPPEDSEHTENVRQTKSKADKARKSLLKLLTEAATQSDNE